MLTERLNQLEQLRQRQRDKDLHQRREAIRKDADDYNQLTLKNNRFVKDFEKKQKERDGKFANSYAPEALMASHEKAEKSVLNQAGDIINVRDKKLTGIKKADPYRLTTVR